MKTGASDKKTDQLNFIVPVCIAVVTLAASGVVLARDVTVGGGVRVGYDFDDRQYDDEEVPADREQQQDAADTVIIDQDNNRDERYSRLRLAPLVTLTSSAERDEIGLRYSPSFWYDLENSDNNVDHDLSATLNRFLSKNWQVRLADKYLRTDEHRYSIDTTDSTAESSDAGPSDAESSDTVTDDTVRLSDVENRRRYWTNDLSLRSEYEYRQDSGFGLGYRYNILKNIDTDDGRRYEDYDRHEFSSQLDHRFNPVWRLSVFGSYVRGLFDEPESDAPLTDEEEVLDAEKDLNEYGAGMTLHEKLLEYHLHTLSYSFYGVDYDAEQRNNAYIHDITLGWQWDVARNVEFGLGAGPSYVKIEGMDGEWDYNANMLFSYSFERGQLRLTAGRGYEVLNFTGTDQDSGLREFWQAKLGIDYRLLDNLSAGIYTSYRSEDQDVPRVIAVTADQENEADESDFITETESLNRERFSTGASLGYTFWKWYRVVLSYDYIRQDSELLSDSFDEHKAALTVSYETELFKW